MSGRPGLTEKRLSAHRFQPLPDYTNDAMMASPHDVTIDIPLTNVTSRSPTGARRNSAQTATSPAAYHPPVQGIQTNTSEKAGLVSGMGPGRRKRTVDDATGRSLDDPDDGTITRMGRIYQAILNFSIVTRYMIYVTPLAVLIAIPIIVGATAAQDARIGGVTLPWFFAWIEVVWLSLWICKIIAHFLPYLFQFLCGIVSPGTRKYALILRALELPIATVFWTLVSLVTFLPVMTYNPEKKRSGDTDVESWEKSVKNILFALFVCSLILLAEKFLVQLISISYHRKQFDQRIKESKRSIELVGQLYDASRNMFPMYCKEFREDDLMISDSLLGAATKGPVLARSSSSVPLKLIRNVGHNVGRFGDRVTAAFGDVAHEITGKEVFNPTSVRGIVTQALERRKAAEALARRIWMSFVVEGRDALYLDDIMEVLGTGKEAIAEECFHMLDRDGNGDISLEEMVLVVGEIGGNRKALNNSMYDVDQAIHVLDNLLLTVAGVIAILVFVSFVTSGFGTVIAAGATSLLSLSFVFATTAQEVLGSCIFLFVKHPFDIGDRVEITDKSYIVERISLLYTVFRSVADQRTTQVPNVVLNTLWVDNFTRSNAMHEQLKIPVSFDTTFADIQMLREEMEAFVRDKDNYRDFQPDIEIDVVGVGDMDKLELTVSIRHKSNWSYEAIRAARRSKFMCALVTAVRKIPIRAPGAAAEEPADDSDDKDDKPDTEKLDPSSNITRTASGQRRMAAAAGMGMDGTGPDLARSTGFDVGQSPGSVQRRSGSSPTAAGSHTDSSYPERSNNRTPGNDGDHYQTPAASPGLEHHNLSVNYGNLNREASTGRRKAGTTPSEPSPATTGGVPIIAEPVPPLPRQHQQQQQQPPSVQSVGQPDYNPYSSPAHYGNSFYGSQSQDTAYDPEQPLELPSAREQSESDPYRRYPGPSGAQQRSPDDHSRSGYPPPRPYGGQ
ncbi:serine/threonine protein kinase [Aspergillus clavatus NRRL 1]|uniref:Serine/threonine protein kinase n=1 Tax=Aspergillus clavatus (strain ATCC 1007 / CBS 513.65 / DSM 816 / NCTC 3887 / NRRL 1 / QM 1276 / 107) TaxID=344612 RepID=A1CT12_ASPCL|nr:serine/threonine protein kinase [Aspergillus clavatus NRRL 1]EAW06449.1 serine/threonine protein kinase [Aspergillus clavatus NRRL 1]